MSDTFSLALFVFSFFLCTMFTRMLLFYNVSCQNVPAAMSPRQIPTFIVQPLTDREACLGKARPVSAARLRLSLEVGKLPAVMDADE